MRRLLVHIEIIGFRLIWENLHEVALSWRGSRCEVGLQVTDGQSCKGAAGGVVGGEGADAREGTVVRSVGANSSQIPPRLPQ